MSVRTNASGDYLQRTANLPVVTNYTVCGWARAKAINNAWQYLAGMENNTENADRWTSIGWRATTQLLHIAADNLGGGLYTNFTRQPTTDEWFFFALTRAGNAADTDCLGYISRATDVDFETIAIGSTMTSFTTANMQFMNNSFGEWVDGNIAHVRVWDAVLNSTELWSERNSATVVRTSNLHLVYRLATATDTNDISGNGKTPTIGGTLTDDSDPPVGSGLDVNTIKLKMKLYNAKLSNIRV